MKPTKNKNLSPEQREHLLGVLKARFEKQESSRRSCMGSSTSEAGSQP